jgi:hypothetical protein
MLRARAPKLARVGLSGAKIRTLKAIAKAHRERRARSAALADKPPTRRTPSSRRAWHRSLDGRHLSALLPRPCRRLAAGDLALQEAAKLCSR